MANLYFRRGDIFESGAHALVNPVNCVGKMGKGLALKFKEKFPENFLEYKKACSKKLIKTGNIYLTSTGKNNPKYIINFPTKNHWKEPSQIEWIKPGLKDLVLYSDLFESIAFPALGCGLGGLSWGEVRPLMVEELKHLPQVHIAIYEPR